MLTPDLLLERLKLKNKVSFWRNIAILFASILAVILVYRSLSSEFLSGSYIAEVNIYDEIHEDGYREKKLKEISKNKHIKAVIVNIDSPGGSTYGGESLYYSILEVSKNKPVVVVMSTMATSAAYMVALPAHHIVARHSTITGSVGVFMASYNFSELSKKLGIKFDVIKSGKLKAEPLPFHDSMDTEVRDMISSIVMSNQDIFIKMVSKHRKINGSALKKVADGRVFSGTQALENNLIDQIGGEEEALAYLKTKHNLDTDSLAITHIPLEEEAKISQLIPLAKSIFSSISNMLMGKNTLSA